MTETLTTQVSSPSAQCASKSLLSSDLEDFAAASSSSELDHVNCDPVNQLVPDSNKSASSAVQPMPAGPMAHTPVLQPDQSPGSRCLLTPSLDLGHGYVSKSSPLLSASGSPTPPTPQSHCSASSPLSQQAFTDVTSVTLPPPPYPAGTVTAEHPMMPPGISSQSPSPIDQARPGMPLPPKKPLTPYMRFSKSIWQKVKAVNQNSSVCEIGATIGRMWREMNDIDKQHYNDDFVHDKVRYDGELQTYLKATGLQASDLAKPKAKRSRAVVPPASASASSRSQLMSSTDSGAVGYVDGLTTADGGNTASGFQTMAANGIVGGGLPHFGQVWLGNAGSEAYGAEKLLAQMDAEGHSSLFANQSTDSDGVLSFHEDVSQQVASLYGDPSQLVNSAVTVPSSQQQQQQSQDAAAMTNWLWQQYALANGDQFGATASTDSMHHNGTDTAANTGNMIIYQLNADGTQTAYTQSMPTAVRTAPAPSTDVLEPGEVRLPQNGPAAPNTEQQLYQGMSALGYQLPGSNNGQWSNHDGGSAVATAGVGSTDAEKQLLRGALVDKVREIQRLTRELEQAYALIHQLKQHNEFLQRQWGQATMMPAAASTDCAALART